MLPGFDSLMLAPFASASVTTGDYHGSYYSIGYIDDYGALKKLDATCRGRRPANLRMRRPQAMRKLTNVLIAMLLALLPLKAALALDCYLGAQGGPVEETKTISPFAIPSNAQVGQKIWESDDIKIPVTCNHDVAGSFEKEDVYAWDPPSLPTPTNWASEGMDYDATGQPNGVDTRQCLDNNNITNTPEQIKQMGEPAMLRPCPHHAHVHCPTRTAAFATWSGYAMCSLTEKAGEPDGCEKVKRVENINPETGATFSIYPDQPGARFRFVLANRTPFKTKVQAPQLATAWL
jgi:hypothetical protein